MASRPVPHRYGTVIWGGAAFPPSVHIRAHSFVFAAGPTPPLPVRFAVGGWWLAGVSSRVAHLCVPLEPWAPAAAGCKRGAAAAAAMRAHACGRVREGARPSARTPGCWADTAGVHAGRFQPTLRLAGQGGAGVNNIRGGGGRGGHETHRLGPEDGPWSTWHTLLGGFAMRGKSGAGWGGVNTSEAGG